MIVLRAETSSIRCAIESIDCAIAAWNDSSALDMRSPAVQRYMLEVVKRAIRASKGKYEGVHAEHKKAAKPRYISASESTSKVDAAKRYL